MESNLLPPETDCAAGRILAIEPDDARARQLHDVLPQYLRVEMEIVPTTAAAVGAIRARVPDLVLTSVFLPPAEEAVLVSLLKALPAASHVQIITVPYFFDDDRGPSRTGRAAVLDFLRRGSARLRPRCSLQEVCAQIGQYLRQAREAQLAAADRFEEDALPLVPTPDGAEGRAASVRRTDRRRTHRRPGDELPSTWTLQIPGAAGVEVVDISRQGVLFETRTKISSGSLVDVQLVGQDVCVTVTARTVRSSMAAVDRLGVRYRTAAVFAQPLDLVELEPASLPTVVPHQLGEVLPRVLREAAGGANEAVVRASFEHELRRILPLRELRIQPMPVVVDRRAEAISFTVPSGSSTRTVLQAVLESARRPSPLELRLLRAAAGLAAIVLQLAQQAHVAQQPARPSQPSRLMQRIHSSSYPTRV